MYKLRPLVCLLLVFCLLFSSVATANASVGMLTLSSPGGLMGVGSALISSPALPILAVILASGFIIYNIDEIASVVNNFFASLSPSAKAEVEQASESGTGSFTLSASTLAEINEMTSNYFFDTDGTFKETGVVFDSTNFSTYDPIVHDYLLAQPDPSISAEFQRTYPRAITLFDVSTKLFDGLTLGITKNKFVNSNYGLENPNAFVLTNTITGAKLYFTSDLIPWLDSFNGYSNCISFRFTTPTVEKVTDSDGTRYILGLNIAKICSYIANQGHCDSCTHYLETYHWKESVDWEQMFLMFQNTGLSYDDKLFKGQAFQNGTWILDGANSTVQDVNLGISALTSICSDMVINRGYDNTYDAPDTNTALYLPTNAALSNANHLTATGALTGNWESTLEDTPADKPEVDTSGFWNTLWDWLQKILDAIKGVPSGIINAINNLINSLKNIIVSGLTSAFVPSTGFFENYFSDLKATFENRLGLLTYPFTVLLNFLDSLLSIQEQEPIFKWNSWSYEGTEFIQAGEYNLNDILKTQIFKYIHDIYLIVIDAFIVLGILRQIERKYQSIISN